jgi:hypothetical protein
VSRLRLGVQKAGIVGIKYRRTGTEMKAFARLTLAILLLASLPVGRARAQTQDYPNRTVTIVAPSAPGGLYSLFARLIGSKLEQRKTTRATLFGRSHGWDWCCIKQSLQ